MKTKYAAQIRAGISEARRLFPAYHLLTKLGKRAYTRESVKYLDALLAGKPYHLKRY